MELRQLEYFMAVCKELHFTRAAEKLGISQPSLSQQIRLLEHYIGTPLFDRIGKKTALTEAGRILLLHSYKVFHELEQARSAIGELQGLERGKIRIGALLTVVNYLLPPTLLEFHKKYPKIEMSVLGLRTGDIRQKLLENELDLGIVFLPMKDKEFETISLYNEDLSLAVSIHDEHFNNEEEVCLDILRKVPTILLPENYYLRQLINKYCIDYFGFQPQPIFEMTTMESLINMVAEGVGVTVLPKPYLEYLKNDRIKMISLVTPTPTRQVGIIYQKDKHMCAATHTFIKQITDIAESI
ncbi:LysR family transcriptional regulator [Aneurinibacillus migulanus]|uniref:DNA-binding transcriptional regulator, LysR family n=1 Tax=Aneurinibacillus migulanus TaxID=47500 RepID=A0A0D1XUE0_ANEMI|nr:LysR substrate-binding domain-containing protein [Aneurinibacillus migulanus]KIV57826.1 LysR family transcriptional regulator [Aneurinibacillus migulanus]KON97417.1 LysR family transcriptional regulator [Aneurinibacillus migulanus]MED0895981.1 LysR substrate-binding domain-containing protein [Aneurinibacillus migulanus]MED1616655.1 LysR substrate-binding domain-containing protein [Aneurinibacillus migulanus]MED4730806.1 LysR substrate-binding domain-containing protein [Aneurinibacillus migu